MKVIKFKKLANHWYPEIEHEYSEDIKVCAKIERYLNYLDKIESEEIHIEFYEQNCFVDNNTLQIEDDSLNKYFTTEDDFDMVFWIGNKNFTISSTLYTILENLYEFNFHTTGYNINIYT